MINIIDNNNDVATSAILNAIYSSIVYELSKDDVSSSERIHSQLLTSNSSQRLADGRL